MKSILLTAQFLLAIFAFTQSPAAPRLLAEAEIQALLATSPVFEERAEQTVQYTLNKDGRVSAFSRWFFWTFSITGSWHLSGDVLCILMQPEDEEEYEMCGRFTHLVNNRYRFDEDDGEQTEIFLVSRVNDGNE